MNVVQQVNEILMRSINAGDDTPDLNILALESELHDVKHKALDLSVRCEKMNRQCVEQAAMIDIQRQEILKLREELKNVRMSR